MLLIIILRLNDETICFHINFLKQKFLNNQY